METIGRGLHSGVDGHEFLNEEEEKNKIGNDNQPCKIYRRIGETWAAYGKLMESRFLLVGRSGTICLKRKVGD